MLLNCMKLHSKIRDQKGVKMRKNIYVTLIITIVALIVLVILFVMENYKKKHIECNKARDTVNSLYKTSQDYLAPHANLCTGQE